MSSCRVFEITELLTAVCENSDDATCARLARTSRLLFEIATPILWAHIVGAHKVLVLLPGSIIGRVKLPAPTPPVSSVAFKLIGWPAHITLGAKVDSPKIG